MKNTTQIKTPIFKYLNSLSKKVKQNKELQKMCDSLDLDEDLESFLDGYNYKNEYKFLGSGMSCYFNDQVDEKGLVNLKLAPEDIEDARFISSKFGAETKYVDNGLSILYTVRLGTVELGYGMQTFPAGIEEDVFQSNPTHGLPLEPFLGEREENYWTRVLDWRITINGKIDEETRKEMLVRGRRLAEKFCSGKNRIYIIPVEVVLDHKATFGDEIGLRNSDLTEKEVEEKIASLKTLRELLEADYWHDYMINPNLTCEDGVPIYGPIQSKEITYIEVDRIFEKIQKDALRLGYTLGEKIPTNGYEIKKEEEHMRK